MVNSGVLSLLEKDSEVRDVWRIFNLISKIPRKSKNESEVINALMKFANENGLETKLDDANNLLVTYRNRKSSNFLALQGHVDMVCVKELSSKHNFEKDPIKWVLEGDVLRANNTTLGADNGIGVAMALALAIDKSVNKPNLEILLTVDEETGMTGAKEIENDFFVSKNVINLDSEDEGEFTVGCSGGVDVVCHKKISYEIEGAGYELLVSGFLGGHSGVNILDNFRPNAIVLLSMYLLELDDIEIGDFVGGDARNAIPKDFKIIFKTNKDINVFKHRLDSIKMHFPEFKYSINNVNSKYISNKDSLDVLRAVFETPSHVIEMDNDIVNLPKTSNNLGTISMDENFVEIVSLLRSSSKFSKNFYFKKISSIYEKYGFNIKSSDEYPGWSPQVNTHLLDVAKSVFINQYGYEPKITATHGGLECGLLKSKYSQADFISFGPTIHNAHTPKELVYVSSVKRTYHLLKGIVQKFV